MLILGVMIVAGVLHATVPIKEGDYPYSFDSRVFFPDTLDPLRLRFNYLYEFAQISQFCADWQLNDPDSVDHGGMIEAESGPLRPVVQTDNTLEAIWVWCRYGELTGDTARFKDNITKAWVYCENFPAWREEGNPGDNYYRDHNAAWGVAAEQRFRTVYDDHSYTWYRDSCVEYLKAHPLNVFSKINRFVNGWCAGWLYRYGVEANDLEAMDSACSLADTLLGWLENMTPQYGLTEEGWAMSAGTMVWGICNSAFQRDSLRGQAWIAENGRYLDTFQTWKNLDYYSWDNSWNVGFANGHGAMYDVSHDETYARNHKWLAHRLLSYDTDADGGIMATTKDADTTDMTWVSLYLCMMGLDRLIGEVYARDVGPLEIIGIYDGDEIEPGTKVDIVAVVTNYGRALLSNVNVTLSGDASGSAASDIPFLGMDTITLVSDWTVPDSAVLVLTTSHSQDQNKANDTLLMRLNGALPGVNEKPKATPDLYLQVSPVNNAMCRVSYNLANEVQGILNLYDILGARVHEESLIRNNGEVILNMTELPRGVYFVQLETSSRWITKRIVLLK